MTRTQLVTQLVCMYTLQNATGDAWNALYLCHVVVGEVAVAGGIEELGVTEETPEFGSDCYIVFLNHFSAYIKAFPH